MLGKLLDRIEPADVEALLTNKVVEMTTLEYKRDLPATDDARREISYDVASLANTRGGDIVFGVDAERDSNDKPTGAPGELLGIANLNLDNFKLRLLQMVESCSKPRIEGLEFRAVGSFKQGPVVVLRVPQSWNGPHMMQYEKSQRFYARTSAGRYVMDIDQIRTAILASASLPEKLDVLRRDRLARVMANDGPHKLGPGAMLMFHVVPFSSLGRARHVAPSLLSRLPMAGISLVGGGNPRINFDGYLLPNTNREGVGVGFVQAFRSGLVESATSRLADGDPPLIASLWLEKQLIQSVGAALQGLATLDIAPPHYVAITLARVRGANLAVSNTHSAGPIDRDVLFLPDVEVERANLTFYEVATLLQPALDSIWQAAGAERSYNFDDSGKWLGR